MDIDKRLESFLAEHMGWRSPRDIDLGAMAKVLGAHVSRNPYVSGCVCVAEGLWLVFVRTDTDEVEQRMDLARGLTYCWLCTSMSELWRELQESQVLDLSSHILAPDYMLAKLEHRPIEFLAHEFRVPVDWMERRMELYRDARRLQGGV